ncbi:transposase [Rhodococcus opacus]|uniref:transposase n=1 Tax=Rhodococcus opacus TaxID=37919 RepID=UPI003AAAE3D5
MLTSIPGFSTTVAEVVLAETGGDMRVFPTAGHLASWAGTAPGSHVRRPGQVHEDQTGQPAPRGRPRHRGAVRVPLEGHLLLGQVQADRVPPRSAKVR